MKIYLKISLTVEQQSNKISTMKINTAKIKSEMKRLNLSLRDLGNRFNPPKDRCAVWYIIHHAKKMSTIDEIGAALDMDGRDLIK